MMVFLGAFEVTVLLQLILGVGVGLRVNIQFVVMLSSIAVNIVPMIASEKLLTGNENVST